MPRVTRTVVVGLLLSLGLLIGLGYPAQATVVVTSPPVGQTVCTHQPPPPSGGRTGTGT